MTRQDVLDKVIGIVREQLGTDAAKIVTEDSRFKEDLNADSLDAVEVIMKIEDELSVNIPEEEANKMETVKSVVDWLMGNLPTEPG